MVKLGSMKDAQGQASAIRRDAVECDDTPEVGKYQHLDDPATRTSHLLVAVMRLRDIAPYYSEIQRADIERAIEILTVVCRREAPSVADGLAGC